MRWGDGYTETLGREEVLEITGKRILQVFRVKAMNVWRGGARKESGV